MLGSTYALIGISFTLILGVLDMLNLALGEVFMLGAFTALTLVAGLHLPFAVGLLGGMVAAGLVSLIIERFSFRPLQNAPLLAPLLSTLGFSILLQNLATIFYGSEQKSFPSGVGNGQFHIAGVLISEVQLIILAVAVVLMFVLEVIVSHTKIGRGMRAVAEDREAAAILGVDSRTVVVFTCFVAGALAGAAGVLVGLTFSSISPFMGTQTGLKGIAVMVVGGMGNVRGAMLAGLLLGIAEVMSVAYISASFRDAVVYGLLIIVLVVRPAGLLGSLQQQTARV